MYYPDNEDEKYVDENNSPKQGETIHPEDEMMSYKGIFGTEENPPAENAEDEFVTQDSTAKEEAPEPHYEPAPEPAPYYTAPDPKPEQPKKKKSGVFVSGAAIAVLLVCIIVFVGIVGVGVWKISEYMKSPTGTGSTSEVTTPADTSKSNNQTTPTENSSGNGQTSITPSGDSSLDGAVISLSSTVTSNTTTAETAMIEKCLRSSVVIKLYVGETLVSGGSGVIYTKDGYIMTNFHVVETVASGTRKAVAVLYDGSQYEATYVLGDMDRDIAVIKIDKDDCEPATIGNSETSVVGERVYAIGNPNGEGITVTEGILSAKNRSSAVRSTNFTITSDDLFLVTSPINAGNSGGGIFNAKGELIAIVNSKTYFDKSGNVVEGEGMAIPISEAVKTINTLIENDGYIPGRAKLGVTVNISGRTLSSGWTSTVYYTCVTKVTEGTGAEKAGIQVGDIITAINGVNLQQYKSANGLISDYDALHMILLGYSVGDTVEVTVLRPESTSTSVGGYQTVTYTEVTLNVTFIDFNYSK